MASCFVISPIGKEGSEVREHADDVWKFIIQPSLTELGINGYRADHMLEAGRITEQMYNSLLNETFCIAILTFYNPNVFYELAIAQSAGKPVIMLIQKGSALPFDLHNIRVIEYDLKPTPLFEGVYVRQLTGMIQGIAQGGWRTDVPFGANLAPLGGGHTEVSICAPAEKYFGTEDWLDIVRRTKTSLDIAAYGLTGWPGFPRMKETLSEAASAGCRIRILSYSPDNPAFAHVFHFDTMASDVSAMGSRFETARRFLKDALRDHEACEVRPIVKGLLFQQIVLFDNELILQPYMFFGRSGHGALIRCNSAFPLYAAARYEFDTLWSLNDTARARPAENGPHR